MVGGALIGSYPGLIPASITIVLQGYRHEAVGRTIGRRALLGFVLRKVVHGKKRGKSWR